MTFSKFGELKITASVNVKGQCRNVAELPGTGRNEGRTELQAMTSWCYCAPGLSAIAGKDNNPRANKATKHQNGAISAL